MRVAAAVLGLETHLLEQRGHPVARLAALDGAVRLQHLGDRGADAHARVERPVRVLEDELHGAAVVAEPAARQPCDVLSVEGDRAAGDRNEPQHGTADRRLPGAALADETEPEGPVGDVERHAGDGAHRTEADFEVAHLEHQAAAPTRGTAATSSRVY